MTANQSKGDLLPVSVEDFRGFGPAQSSSSDLAKEVAALREFGVHLAPDHFDGYMYRPDSCTQDSNAVKKPWEVGLLEQLGPSVPFKCDSVQGWSNEDVLFEVREGIAYCTLNRPSTNNDINDGVVAGIHDAALLLRQRPDIRICVLTGIGRMFCAGASPLSLRQGLVDEELEREEGPPVGTVITSKARSLEQKRAGVDTLSRILYEWASVPQFTICCLNGSAMGGGVGLAAVCDMVIAVHTAHVTLSEVKLGVIPAAIAPHVVRALGINNCRRLFCTAENANMTLAMEMGLVQRVVNAQSEFAAAIKDVSQKILACAPGAVAAAKQVILNCHNQPVSDSMIEYGAREYARVRHSTECEEGMQALASRKRPSWAAATIAVRDT